MPASNSDHPAAALDDGFRVLFGQSVVPMMLADDERRLTAANGAALALFRMDTDIVASHRVDDLTSAELRPLIPTLWERFIAEGTWTGEYELQRLDGSPVAAQFNATANVAPGQHLAIFIRHGDSGLPSKTQRREDGSAGGLSPRQRQVLRLVAYGKSGPEIAEALDIAPDTVRVHVRNAMHRLGATTRAQAIGIALASGDI